MDVYKRWFEDTVWTGKNSNALTIMPLESMAPRYRDQPPTYVNHSNLSENNFYKLSFRFRRPPQDGINALALAPVMKSPVLAVPSKKHERVQKSYANTVQSC